MITILVCNILLVLCITALAGLFGKEGERLLYAWFAFVLTAGFTWTGWIIFVVVHFASKYW
jgi:hypothetical protein